MRKYDSKNKRNIGIIVGICILFAIIFSYFLIKEIKLSKIKYELEESTILFDNDKNSILLYNTGTVKKKWNQKYYLNYEKEQYNIGTHVIAYNNNESSLYLYGQFYEVKSNSEVDITKEETIVNNLGISRFYKVADRKYLIVDSNIRTADESLKTSNYLIIELDKQGNALLYNNNLNVKVFSATKILTTSYTFDIANELLIYENETIDLKKILGTTNEYKEPDKNDDDKLDEENENIEGNGQGNNGGGTGNGDVPGTDNGNDTGTGNGTQENETPEDNPGQTGDDDIITDETGPSVEDNEIINQTAYTSIIRIVPTTNSISIDYVIYDKMGEYLSTFVEIKSGSTYNVVHLSKSSTNISITNLDPGRNYELTFKYTHLDEDLVKEETIDTHNVKTLLPEIKLVGTKVTNKKIEYKVSISSYNIDSAFLRLYINGEKQEREINITNSSLNGEFNITGINFPSNALVELKLEDIYINGIKIDKTSSWSYKAATIITPEPENPTPGEPTEPGDETDTPVEENGGGENNNE